MSAKKDGEEGGLMYQQLRKFINVIVSFLLILSWFRMNFVMLVSNNTSSFQE
jgi:hypothetical protein